MPTSPPSEQCLHPHTSEHCLHPHTSEQCLLPWEPGLRLESSCSDGMCRLHCNPAPTRLQVEYQPQGWAFALFGAAVLPYYQPAKLASEWSTLSDACMAARRPFLQAGACKGFSRDGARAFLASERGAPSKAGLRVWRSALKRVQSFRSVLGV